MSQTQEQEFDFTNENFAAMLDEIPGASGTAEGSVVKGRIIRLENDFAIIDIGLKSEGRVLRKEFGFNQQDELRVGDLVDVYLERLEDRNGEISLSREKAKREEAWIELENMYKDGKRVNGVILSRVKGGFTVDLAGATAFLPGSQVDVRPVRDVTPIIGVSQPFQILKMDRARGNIVVSRRAVLEESRAEARSELVANLEEGQLVKGTVKNITDYGAFIDLGGVDGLLHVTDISWKRISHPSEALQVGQLIEAKIIRFNKENQRISLGMKQLEIDPWADIQARYPLNSRHSGAITNIADYGAFVELEAGIEGLVHVSEMSWTKKNLHPNKLVTVGQPVDVIVLDVDDAKRRISLGIKQCTDNPWQKLTVDYPVGTVAEVPVKNITEFGLFVGLTDDIDGMVHLSDLTWESSPEDVLKQYNKGDMVKVTVLEIDPEKERISLGIKQLSQDPFEEGMKNIKKGAVVTCVISTILDSGIEVNVGEGLTGFIKKTELSRERSEQKPSRFAIGEKIDAKITQIDATSRKIILSIKAREVDEDKQAMEEYGSSDSGASLGDILGAAMNKARKKEDN